MSPSHLDNNGTIFDKVMIPEDWQEVRITFYGSIDAAMNVTFATLGHRVHVESGTIENGISEGTPNIITIHRTLHHGRAYLSHFLEAFKLQHPRATIAFATREKTAKSKDPNQDPNTGNNAQQPDSLVPQIISEALERLRRAFSDSA